MHRLIPAGSVAMAMLIAACVGNIGGGGDDEGAGPNGGTSDDHTIGPSPLRRLSRVEYDNTVRDLFHLDAKTSYADGWPADGIDSGFDNDLNGQGATSDLVEQMMRSAEAVASDAVARLAELLPCSAASGSDAKACGTQFIEQYGKRAYRRPLGDDDKKRLGSVLAYGLDHGDLKTAVRLVTTAMLQSPSFVYRPELGAGAGDDLTEYELASRLSYLLTNSTPDDALLEAADAGKLHDPDQLRAQAERLLDSPAGHRAVDHFFTQWMPFERLSRAVKSSAVYPEFDDTLRAAMASGARAFIQHVVFESDQGNASELFSAQYAFVNAKTAPLYGLTATGDALQKLATTQPRAGLLTDAAVMTALSDNYQSSPVARGKFVYKDLLCQDLLPPPANLPAAGVPPPPDESKTTRERFDEHRKNPVCAGCHKFMDPLGFALENYDAIGRYRATENGKPIDATGSVPIEGVETTFDGAQQLGKFVASSPLFRECFSRKWFTYAAGRVSAAEDDATLRAYAKLLGDGSVRIRDFLVATTQTWAFTHRKPISLEKTAESCTP